MKNGKVEPQGWGPILPGLGADIVQLLQAREGLLTLIHLDNGSIVEVISIAWGRDFGEMWEHVYLYASCEGDNNSLEFVHASNITQIIDPLSGRILYTRSFSG